MFSVPMTPLAPDSATRREHDHLLGVEQHAAQFAEDDFLGRQVGHQEQVERLASRSLVSEVTAWAFTRIRLSRNSGNSTTVPLAYVDNCPLRIIHCKLPAANAKSTRYARRMNNVFRP